MIMTVILMTTNDHDNLSPPVDATDRATLWNHRLRPVASCWFIWQFSDPSAFPRSWILKIWLNTSNSAILSGKWLFYIFSGDKIYLLVPSHIFINIKLCHWKYSLMKINILLGNIVVIQRCVEVSLVACMYFKANSFHCQDHHIFIKKIYLFCCHQNHYFITILIILIIMITIFIIMIIITIFIIMIIIQDPLTFQGTDDW